MSRMIMNLKIGTKLAIASVLSILLVGGMIYMQMHGNAAVSAANHDVIRLQTVLHNMVDSKASVRGMQIGVRDIRLAASPDALQKAGNYLSIQKKSANGFAEDAQKQSRNPEQLQRFEKYRTLIGDYASGAQQIAAVKAEAIGIDAKRAAGSELPADAVAKLAKLNDEAGRLAREVTLPIAAELEALSNKVVEFAKARADEQAALAVQEMSSAERTGLSSASWRRCC